MALFKNKKTEDKADALPVKAASKKPVSPAKAKSDAAPSVPGVLAHVLRNPRITEKATDMRSGSVYAFDVADTATKRQIIEAVHALYNVKARKVAILRISKKVRRNMRTGKTGITRGGKKAYVYLVKGETISLA